MLALADGAHCTPPTRPQHDRNHAHYCSVGREQIFLEKDLGHEVGTVHTDHTDHTDRTDHLAEVWFCFFEALSLTFFFWVKAGCRELRTPGV